MHVILTDSVSYSKTVIDTRATVRSALLKASKINSISIPVLLKEYHDETDLKDFCQIVAEFVNQIEYKEKSYPKIIRFVTDDKKEVAAMLEAF